MRYRSFVFAAATAAALTVTTIAGHAEQPHAVWITAQEAKLAPMAQGETRTRGVTIPGPKIVLVSPQQASAPLHHPFKIVLKFEPTDGAKVKLDTLKVTYLKLFGIDITDRIRPFVSEQGINANDPAIPPGEHAIRFEIGDTKGRVTSQVYRFTIS